MPPTHLMRILEPEVMDTLEAAAAYDATDFRAVNRAFCDDLLAEVTDPQQPQRVLDVGTGTARIPQLLSQEQPHWQITAVDLSEPMLAIAAAHVQPYQITLCQGDAKALPFGAGTFTIVLSNSLIHHLADPRPALGEMLRVLQPGGLLFVRDLCRPSSLEHLQALLECHAQDCTAEQRQLFADSLHAALTLDEMAALLAHLSPPPRHQRITATSDRHWTVVARR